MVADVRARLADALLKHRGFPAHCVCGWKSTDGWKSTSEKHEHHLADVLLSLPGIAIVALPEADEEGEWLNGDLVASARNRLRLYGLDDSRLSSSEGREIAAALLAAANAAERGDDGR